MNDLIVDPHPLTTQGRVIVRAALAYPRESLGEFLERNGVALAGGRWVVTIGGAVVPAAMWACTRPKAGQLIVCRAVPGKQAVYAVAMIALTVFTFGAAAPFTLAGLTGLAAGSVGLFALQAGVYMIGSLVINKLLGPSRARLGSYDHSTGSTYSLQGGRNRARPYEPLGLLFGITKVVPDFNAQPFSWFASDDQYQAVRLHAGINCGSVTGFKIGTTPLSSFNDVDVSRVGFPSGNSVLPFWSDVDTLAGATLDAPSYAGSWVMRTSSANAVMLAVDVVAQLYAMDSKGRMTNASLTIELERRLLPGGGWVPLLDAGASVTLTSASTKALRRTFTSSRLSAGQYEVRARKMTANQSSSTTANVIDWVTLKTYQEDPSGGYAHQNPQIALSIKASGQLNGTLDEVSWVATQSSVPVWNGSAWVNEATRNPGAHILLLARGIFDGAGRLVAGLGWPDSQIDIEGLKAFMLHCAANGYVFDHWFDSGLSCIEMLEAIAAAGMGSISFHPGKLSVVWLASSQPLEAVVTMGNIKQGSFRVDHTTTTTADELEVSWFDRDADWANRSLRIKAPGVATPRDTARLAPLGVTTEAAAVRVARLTMAQNIYQRKSVSWEMDLEHMAFQRYSLIALSHDVTQWGYSGRVQSAAMGGGSIVTLTLDDKVPWNAGAAARKIGVRIPGESGYRIFGVAAFAGESNVVTLTEAWPGGVALPGNSAANPAHDTLWIYDFAATPGKRLRVTDVEPTPDLSGAKITAVPEPDEFWTYMASGAYTAPAAPPAAQALVASNIAVTQRRLAVNVGEGTELSISFDVAGPLHSAQVWGAPAGEALQPLGATLVPRFGPWTVTRDNVGSYTIEVRPFDALGRPGTKASKTHTVALADESTAWTDISGKPADAAILNSNVSIGANGALAGAGGGQATLPGMGYTGDLNATNGATWGGNLTGVPTGVTSHVFVNLNVDTGFHEDEGGAAGYLWNGTDSAATGGKYVAIQGGWTLRIRLGAGSAFQLVQGKAYRVFVRAIRTGAINTAYVDAGAFNSTTSAYAASFGNMATGAGCRGVNGGPAALDGNWRVIEIGTITPNWAPNDYVTTYFGSGGPNAIGAWGSAYVAIDWVYFQPVNADDGATVGANFGVNIGGQITAGNASTYVGGGAIGTPQLGSGAVTQVVTSSVASYYPASWTGTGGWSMDRTLGSITTSANGDGKVLLLVNGASNPETQKFNYISHGHLIGGAGWNYLYSRIRRNGVIIHERAQSWTGTYTRELFNSASMVIDTPGAGVTATYTLECASWSQASCQHSAGIPDLSVALMEIRK